MQSQNIEQFLTGAGKLAETHLTQEEAPTVAVMGPYNSGKSTLINQLLEQNLSPVDIIPATPVPVRFSYGKRFLARVYFTDRQLHTLTVDELAGFLTRKAPHGSEITRVEVRHKHPLLKKMHIIDTPGIDALQEPSSLTGRLPALDHIVYLMQQRGLNETDRQHIQKLLTNNRPEAISFWINCNLGPYDGTSLEESRRFLRQICGGEVTVHLINTLDHGDISKFRLFIENRAAVLMLQSISVKLKELDRKIPDIIDRSMRENNDANFLVQFWPAAEHARQILHSQNIIKTLPPVTQQIESLLKKPARPAVEPESSPVVYSSTGPRHDPVVIREKILALLEQAIADPTLASYPESIRQLESLHGRLKKENYLVTAAGGFSSGKSTFFNALIGEAILPAENRPTTSAITLLKHGRHKKATINYSRQVVIPTHRLEGGQAILCRHELAAMEHWLTNPKLLGEIYALEKSKNGRLAKVTAEELLDEIELLKKSFARVKREFSGHRRPWKSLFKKISKQKFLASQLADYFIIHFKDAASQVLALDTPDGQTALAEILGSHLALRVADIVVEHPAEPLRLATYVDTPGLDSVYHHHREITSRYLPLSDCFIFFLNGKHILTQPDMGVWEMIRRAMQDKQQSDRKMFIVVNFVDTLTGHDRDKVSDYLRENLVTSGGAAPGNIHFISALDSLTGRDKTNFFRLIQQLKERIWELRCTDNYREFLLVFRNALPGTVLQNTNQSDSDTDQQLAALRQEVQTLQLEIKQKTAHWRGEIASFGTKEDFRGFLEGQKSIRKGFLGLSRKSVPVPSYQDMSTSINSSLTGFLARWSGYTDGLTFTGLDTTGLKKSIMELLNKKFNFNQARKVLNQHVTVEEQRIYSAIKKMEHQIESQLKLKAPTPGQPGVSPAALMAAHRYITEINKLENDIFGNIRR